jgi:hypothetical protein
VSLIGRSRELAAVRRLLDRAAAGIGGQLIVSGPPGSGKTAIAEAAAVEARARGLEVTWSGNGHVGSAGHGLVVLDDLDRSVPEVSAELRRRPPAGSVAVLVTVTGRPPGSGSHLQLAPLTPHELAELVPDLPRDAVHALWLASAGRPGTARDGPRDRW